VHDAAVVGPSDAGGALERVVTALELAGCVAADEEAEELLLAAAALGAPVDDLVARRVTGEPLPWITGSTTFCGLRVRVDPGVYVPRWHSEAMARRAAEGLPDAGLAVDLCTGAGAVAAVLRHRRPRATVLATDLDPLAVACARSNGVVALLGDLDAPLPPALRGHVDVLTAVVPYVPTEALHLLPRDTLAFEPVVALDGGPGGLRLLAEVVARGATWVRPGGVVLLEVGGDLAAPVADLLDAAGITPEEVLADEEGDDRAVVGRRR
jgi:release factor glutamine methyltransferase